MSQISLIKDKFIKSVKIVDSLNKEINTVLVSIPGKNKFNAFKVSCSLNDNEILIEKNICDEYSLKDGQKVEGIFF